MDDAHAGPHDWTPRSTLWPSWVFSSKRRREICTHCYLPKDAHPVTGWVVARPLGDDR